MEQRTRVYICSSPNKRTGTTTTARLLTDYFIFNGRNFAGFDTDPQDADYGARFPQAVTIVDVAKVQGQVAMFDRLLVHDETPKIVDVSHRSYDEFWETIDQIGFMDEARAVSIQPIVLFHVDASGAALAAAQALAGRWPDLNMVVVTNKGAAPFGRGALEILAQFPSPRRLVIGALDPSTRAYFEAADFSLPNFLRTRPSDMSIVIRIGLTAWVAPIFTQFRAFETDVPFGVGVSRGLLEVGVAALLALSR
ncbi:hypothetical protein SAMN05444161_1385 [Rhizobiales bacterium GAS191]|jgi:hypothetical protein|nr:hypothetical protein SAMN05444161_1385 [Rhizobiales bacterium GAS191]